MCALIVNLIAIAFKGKFIEACKIIDDEYNEDITLEELLCIIQEAKNKSTGYDEISNKFIKRLPLSRIEKSLTIANQGFKTGYVHSSWKVGMVIPILKPGKDKHDISSYRSISFLPCLGKIVEGVIQKRLQFIVDTKKLLDRSQMGFCKGQGTMDLHVQLSLEVPCIVRNHVLWYLLI